MKKLEMVIKPEKLESLKSILDDSQASGVMITNIMGYGNQKGFTRTVEQLMLLIFCRRSRLRQLFPMMPLKILSKR